MRTESIGIVGGGLLGLSLADRLSKLGHRVTVLEAAPHFGGLASAWTLDFVRSGSVSDGFTKTVAHASGSDRGKDSIRWDQFYHVILQSDSHTHALLRDLGLENDFIGVTTRTGFYTDGRLYSMSNSWEFLTFPPLGLWSKFRLVRTISHAAKVTDWKAMEQVSVVDWLTEWSGKKTVEKIWLPLLKSKLGDAYKVASAAFIWATIQRMYAARRSGMKKELFGYVRGGYGRIVDHFTGMLATRGVELRTNAAVVRIDSDATPRTELATGEALTFDRVICTAVPPLAAKLLPTLTEREAALLNGVRYQGIVCASVLLRKPLDRFYVTNITDDWVPFTGIIEMSALVDRTEFGGHHLVYLPKYVAPNDPVMSESDESIRERFTAALERMYPHFKREDVLAFRIARVKNVFAVPTLNYSETLPPMATSLPGVFLVNSAHIVNGTLNVNETLQLAERATEVVTA